MALKYGNVYIIDEQNRLDSVLFNKFKSFLSTSTIKYNINIVSSFSYKSSFDENNTLFVLYSLIEKSSSYLNISNHPIINLTNKEIKSLYSIYNNISSNYLLDDYNLIHNTLNKYSLNSVIVNFKLSQRSSGASFKSSKQGATCDFKTQHSFYILNSNVKFISLTRFVLNFIYYLQIGYDIYDIIFYSIFNELDY